MMRQFGDSFQRNVAGPQLGGLGPMRAAGAQSALGRLDFNGQPVTGNNLFVGFATFKFDQDIPIGATVDETAANTAAAINALSGDAQCTAVAGGPRVSLTAATTGSGGNSITLDTNDPNISVTPFSGGAD